MAKTYTLGDHAMRAIVADHVRLRSEVQAIQENAHLNRPTPTNAMYYVGYASGNITARAGTTVGTGTVDVYYRRLTDNTLQQAPLSLTVYNQAGQVDDGNVVGISKDAWGDWWVTVEDCS